MSKYYTFYISLSHQCAKCIYNRQCSFFCLVPARAARKPKVISLDRIDSNKTTATEKSVTLESLVDVVVFEDLMT